MLGATALLDLLLGTDSGKRVAAGIAQRQLHLSEEAQSHSLRALWRLHRQDRLGRRPLLQRVQLLARLPAERHPTVGLLGEALGTDPTLGMGDSLSLALGRRLGLDVLSTDPRLAAVSPGVVLV